MSDPLHRRPRERGVALVCALVLLLGAMLAGVSVARAVAASNASARGMRDRILAEAAAEAALRDAERDIAGGHEPGRAAHFTAPGAGGFPEGCGRGAANRGLCRESRPPAWQALDLGQESHPALVPYGHYTGARLPVGRGLLAARKPAYLIERLDLPDPGGALGDFYRITAIGFGAHPSSRVVLQAVYRKPRPAALEGGKEGQAGDKAENKDTAAAELPAGRIGWREIGNWRQLHQQTLE